MERPELEDIQETGNRFADGLLLPIFAVAAVFLFIVLCFYAYNHVMKNKNSNEDIILDGEESDFKVAAARSRWHGSSAHR
jgi:predicted membrane protein